MASAAPKRPTDFPKASSHPLYAAADGYARPAPTRSPDGEKGYVLSLGAGALLLGAGAALCAYRGLLHLLGDRGVGDPSWCILLLGLAVTLQTTSWAIALKDVLSRPRAGGAPTRGRGAERSRGFLLAQDSVALAGMLAASGSLYLGTRWHAPLLSGSGWVLFAAVFAGSAAVLGAEARKVQVRAATVRSEGKKEVNRVRRPPPRIRGPQPEPRRVAPLGP